MIDGQYADADQPTMTCPRCAAEYEDFDGFGVVFCPRCRFCRHLARHGSVPSGDWICDYCGDVEKEQGGRAG